MGRGAALGLIVASTVLAGAGPAGAQSTQRERAAAVPVCQATGDGAYVLVRVLPERLTEYRTNPDNLVPAPPGGCPERIAAAQAPEPAAAAPAPVAPPVTAEPAAPGTTPSTPAPSTPGTTPSTPAPSTPGTTPSTPAPSMPPPTTREQTAPEAGAPQPTTPEADAGDPGALDPAATTPRTTSPAVDSAATVRAASRALATSPYTGALPEDLVRLPNTGDEPLLVLFLGVDLLVLGLGLRLRSRPAVPLGR